MFYGDHPPPHFHAEYGGQKAVFDMQGAITQGSFPPRAEKLVREWVQDHQAELMDAWSACASNQQPNKIDPLE